ncbi:2-hydroxy-3-oxopropionate reductase [Amycolatopsis sp. 195334CR]|uniref:2-hydroxy-3-oxopropionate reductase n=1 Tax=Amycolatopsis sp. 195334CR TaxID=2814588 RepID=UPI001A8C3AAA|nr:2-hydroxy-3-oxopropionate reductase [Amycolatopsis sp. 195334CR]MBN6041860.1 2-hydroxy-3-oxopropionate reductase [Amycolatopsis sp. 195334CR]
MTDLAFIGLGIMGAPMARNLVRAGFTVTGYDLEAKAVARLAEDGGKAAGSVADAIDGADVVITMLPADPHVEAVVLGEGGVFETIKPGTLFIDFSTIKPETSQKVAEAGARKEVRVLDAPVSGGEAGAVNAVLSIMAGGTQADFDAAKPVFDAVGKVAALVGPNGAGQVVKAANQLVVGGTYALVAEAIVLLEASGVDARAGLDVLAGGLAASRILELKRESMLARDFRPGFRIDLHHKDMGIVLDAARQAEVSLPFGGQVAALVQAARAQGLGDSDHSALLTVVERLSGRGGN